MIEKAVDFAVRYRYPGATASRADARTALNHAKLVRETMRRDLGLVTKVERQTPGRGRPKTAAKTTRKRK